MGFAAGDANLARYVGNQPTTAADPTGLEEPAFYRLRRQSEPGDWFYPGRNPGEKFWRFCLRNTLNTLSNPSFQNQMAFSGPGSNFGGAQNLNLSLKSQGVKGTNVRGQVTSGGAFRSGTVRRAGDAAGPRAAIAARQNIITSQVCPICGVVSLES